MTSMNKIKLAGQFLDAFNDREPKAFEKEVPLNTIPRLCYDDLEEDVAVVFDVDVPNGERSFRVGGAIYEPGQEITAQNIQDWAGIFQISAREVAHRLFTKALITPAQQKELLSGEHRLVIRIAGDREGRGFTTKEVVDELRGVLSETIYREWVVGPAED